MLSWGNPNKHVTSGYSAAGSTPLQYDLITLNDNFKFLVKNILIEKNTIL
jgi:hypothetical protein